MSSGPSSRSLDLMSELGCRQRAPRKQLFCQCGMFWKQIFRKSKATTTKAVISAPVLWHRGHGEGGDMVRVGTGRKRQLLSPYT